MPNTPADDELRTVAVRASARAYAPYSGFPVGAALRSASGAIYAGANVENASYSLTLCAERAAIAQMVAAGETEVRQIVVYTPTATPTAPCGACRQVLFEFGPDAQVISICDGPDALRGSVAELLPGAFGPANLDGTSKR